MTTLQRLACFLSTAALLAIAGCASPRAAVATYDFGIPKNAQPNAAALPPISIADPRTPAWLDSPQMVYRLRYANEQQANTYASNRWAMPPAQLFVERLKSRIGQAGGTVLSAGDGATNLPVLHIELNDFSQTFDAPNHSSVQVNVRASLFQGRALIAQKTFAMQAETPSADAPGGARALADASDAIIGDLLSWLAAQPLKR